MIRNALLGSVAAIAISTSAFAADLAAMRAPLYAPAPIFTWTGFYIGSTVGAVGLQTKYRADDSTGDLADSATGTGGGALVGATAGYNYQMGAVVLGIEGDYSFSTAGNSGSGFGIPQASAQMRSFGTVRGRLGLAVDRTLFYVTGGVAFANLKGSSTNFLVNNSSCIAGFSGNSTGFVVGGGVEYALTDHVSLKVEGLYTDLGRKSAVNALGCNATFKNTATIGRVGLNYKF
jgi:outer membrane immunogenic protein